MNKARFLSYYLLAFGLLLAVPASAIASPHMNDNRSQSDPFRPLEQPLSLKVGVTLGGLALIGAELWWFMGKKAKVQQARITQGLQELNVTVQGGYQPDYLMLESGTPVKLNFLRKDANSCLEQLLIPDFGIDVELPLNEVKSVEFTPEKPGEYGFTCGMRMYRGRMKVREKMQEDNKVFSQVKTSPP